MMEVTVLGSWGYVGLAGEYDIANAREITSVVGVLVEQGLTDLTVDLSRVTFMGAAALNALVMANRLLEAVGARMMVVGATNQIDRLFVLLGLGRQLCVAAVPALGDRLEGADPTREALTGRLLELGRLLLTEPTLTADLRRVTNIAVRCLPGTSAASVTLLAHGAARTAAVSDSVAIELDAAQYVLDEGPCLDAARWSELVRTNGADDRFPHFAQLAQNAGVHMVLSVPIHLAERVVGSLNLYSETTIEPTADVAAEVIAGQAATAMAKLGLLAGAKRAEPAHYDFRPGGVEGGPAGTLAGLRRIGLEQAQHLSRLVAPEGGETPLQAVGRFIGHLSRIPSNS